MTENKKESSVSKLSQQQIDQVNSRFGFHKPDCQGVADMTTVRKKVRELAFLIEELCPESGEKTTAFTQLAVVMMHANSAIVQKYPLDQRDFG